VTRLTAEHRTTRPSAKVVPDVTHEWAALKLKETCRTFPVGTGLELYFPGVIALVVTAELAPSTASLATDHQHVFFRIHPLRMFHVQQAGLPASGQRRF
jgi:hypothetical protein